MYQYKKNEEKKEITQTEKDSLVLTQLGLSYIQKKKKHTPYPYLITNDMSVILNQFQKVFEDFFLYMGTTSFVTSNFLIQTKKINKLFNKPNHEDLYV